MRKDPLYPLTLEPHLRPMPWGGNRLANWVNHPFFADTPIGEVWLLSDHSLHASRVKNGPLAGCSLRELAQQRSIDLVGRELARFPLLVKLLDARENLSIQVHPDDVMAKRLAPNEGGKTEAWHVLEADPPATIYLGLKPDCNRDSLVRSLGDGTIPACLQQYHPRPGETYFVPAGTIHALGGGLVVLEVQQTSDATFRLFDWGRVDAAGRPRPLHVEAGMAALQEATPDAGLQRPRPIAGRQHGQHLVSCAYFAIDRFTLREGLPLTPPCLWFGLHGAAAVTSSTGAVDVGRGELAFVPACLTDAVAAPQDRCEGILISLGNLSS